MSRKMCYPSEAYYFRSELEVYAKSNNSNAVPVFQKRFLGGQNGLFIKLFLFLMFNSFLNSVFAVFKVLKSDNIFFFILYK